MFKGVNIIEFSERFATDDACRKYLSEIKWENGYQCGKCGHTHFYKIKRVGSRQCVNCKYAESATARTLFHKVKFPLRKAFYIAFMVVTNKKGMSSYELSRKLGLRQKTCWSFRQKVIEAMKSDGNNPLKGDIEVDEFYVGGPEEGKTGHGNETKQQVVWLSRPTVSAYTGAMQR
ncbi:IS1595 family transposase [Mucilaginibacter sp. 10I4]|uniref:IS1595 family transposase n=1 Tax=Mucilaginibacter sp. 10I4 TaxID=3048580 RepID=UPI002B236052|nr:IS1595 family transposase [Mucilaginibacter sp. 10I4]MEB0262041.1 IS1595 family transposase [Mucilaginibacter sp. 10I4]